MEEVIALEKENAELEKEEAELMQRLKEMRAAYQEFVRDGSLVFVRDDCLNASTISTLSSTNHHKEILTLDSPPFSPPGISGMSGTLNPNPYEQVLDTPPFSP